MKKHTLKRILALVGKYPFSLLAVILFAAAEVAATLYVPVLVGDGVDLIAGKGNVNFEELKIVFYKIGVAISVGFGSPNGWWVFSTTASRSAPCRKSGTRRSIKSTPCP